MTVRAGLWRELASEVASRPGETGVGLWKHIVLRPGKLWREADQETLIVHHRRVNVWQAASETIGGAAALAGEDLWRRALPATSVSPTPPDDLWVSAGEETRPLARRGRSSWMNVNLGRDLSRLRPVREEGWALKEMADARGGRFYVLQNSREGSALHLKPEHILIWDMLDGRHTLQEIAMSYMAAYGTLDIDSLLLYLETLRAKGFLGRRSPDVYQEMRSQVERPGLLARWLDTIRRNVLQLEFPVRGIDSVVGWAYRAGVRYLFTVPGQALLAATIVLGLSLFVRQTISGQFSAVRGAGDSYALGGLALFAARAVALLVHASGHAFTCKHFGRPIRRGGVLVYYLLPYFYVDTSDAWLEPRWRRIALTGAGPAAGFVLAGVCSAAAALGPWPAVSGFLYQVALLSIVVSFINVNPLLKLDGYYMLMDWLEMPNLMERSVEFVRQSLGSKLRRRERWTTQEKLYTAYGLLASAWTVIAIVAVLALVVPPVLRMLRVIP